MFYDTRSGQIITISIRIWTKCLTTWETVTRFVKTTTFEKLKKLTVRNSGDYDGKSEPTSKNKKPPLPEVFLYPLKFGMSESCQKKMIIITNQNPQILVNKWCPRPELNGNQRFRKPLWSTVLCLSPPNEKLRCSTWRWNCPLRHAPALTPRVHPAYSVIEEIVEGFVEDYWTTAGGQTATPRRRNRLEIDAGPTLKTHHGVIDRHPSDIERRFRSAKNLNLFVHTAHRSHKA